MKIDLETILYIIVSIIIIAASSLGRKKRKQAHQAQPAGDGSAEEEGNREEPFSAAEYFRKEMLGEEYRAYRRKDEDEESIALDEESYTEPGTLKASREKDEPLEQIIDEEEVYLAEKEEERRRERRKDPQVTGPAKERPASEVEAYEREELFGNASEIQRGIIYSEIFRRPDY